MLAVGMSLSVCAAEPEDPETQQPEKPQKYALTLPACGPNGSLSVEPDSPEYELDSLVTITAAADEGYVFDGWTSDAELPSYVKISDNSINVKITDNPDLSAISAVFVDEQTGDGRQILTSGSVIDKTAPYRGDYVMAYRPGYSTFSQQQNQSGAALYKTQDHTVADGAELSVDPYISAQNGEYAQIELHDSVADDISDQNRNSIFNVAADIAPQNSPELEDVQVFKTYDLSLDSSNNRKYEWIDTDFVLKGIGEHVYVWFEQDNPAQITDEQFAQMTQSFDSSYKFITDNMNGIYDRNGNGRLDVLIYDIQDSADATGLYYAGFFSSNDLYTSKANCADIIHLDTYPTMVSNITPDITPVLRTMAHETQHLACASYYRGYESNYLKAEQMPPVWIDEGISMAVEHELFGALTDRIAAFNSISGGFRLNNWSSSDPLKSYALSYVFFQYLKAQGGGIKALSKFYTAYDSDEQKANGVAQDNLDAVFAGILSEFDSFNGMTPDQIIETFYAAVIIKDPDGIYGFAGDPAFESLNPSCASGIPQSLPVCGAVYIKTSGLASQLSDDSLKLSGLARAEYTVTVDASDGGSAKLLPQKQIFHYGDKIKFSSVPFDGMLFVGWSGDVAPENMYMPEFEAPCTANAALTAEFTSGKPDFDAASYCEIKIPNSDARLEYAVSEQKDADAAALLWTAGNGAELKIGGLSELTEYYLYTRFVHIPSVFIVSDAAAATEKKPQDPTPTQPTTEPEQPTTKPSGSSSGGGGGGSSRRTEPTTTAATEPPITEPPLIELPADILNHWAKEPIKKLMQNNIITGYPDGSFRPDNSVTRAEFAAVLARVFGQASSRKSDSGKSGGSNEAAANRHDALSDISGHWASEYISSAAQNGYMTGSPSGLFEPDRGMTREELAVVIFRIMKANSALDEPIVQGGTHADFSDFSQISDWARQAVVQLTRAGIITGYTDNSFRPKGTVTRAEMSSVVSALVEKISGTQSAKGE